MINPISSRTAIYLGSALAAGAGVTAVGLGVASLFVLTPGLIISVPVIVIGAGLLALGVGAMILTARKTHDVAMSSGVFPAASADTEPTDTASSESDSAEFDEMESPAAAASVRAPSPPPSTSSNSISPAEAAIPPPPSWFYNSSIPPQVNIGKYLDVVVEEHSLIYLLRHKDELLANINNLPAESEDRKKALKERLESEFNNWVKSKQNNGVRLGVDPTAEELQRAFHDLEFFPQLQSLKDEIGQYYALYEILAGSIGDTLNRDAIEQLDQILEFLTLPTSKTDHPIVNIFRQKATDSLEQLSIKAKESTILDVIQLTRLKKIYDPFTAHFGLPPMEIQNATENDAPMAAAAQQEEDAQLAAANAAAW